MTAPRTLAAWLEYLERLHPEEIELGLERVGAVAARLGSSRFDCPVVTIAGTNGKGSCVALLESVLAQAGWRVAAYTSPHILRYNERVRIGGREASDAELCEAFSAVEAARNETPLTWFEFGTLAALHFFRGASPDVVLLEVGLGGRLDAVNIIDADIAVVTSVDLDHQTWLGSDRESIGGEKAAICRQGRPLISGDPLPPQSIADTASATGARLLQRDRDFGAARSGEGGWRWWGKNAKGDALEHKNLPPVALPFSSAVTALQVLAQLDAVIPERALHAGLLNARLSGRWQQLDVSGVPLLLDVAHNPAAARLLAAELSRPPARGPVICVLAMLDDKDAPGFVAALAPAVDHWIVAELPGVARAASAEKLETVLRDSALAASRADDVATALERARQRAGESGRVLATGSFFTVAAACRWWDAQREKHTDGFR